MTPPSLELVSHELDQVLQRMLEVVQVDDVALARIVALPLQARGKGLRPAIALLAARASGDPDPGKLIALAVAVELLHTATLVHDDLVDAASLRRGKPTISSLWGANLAVLAGDYLFAQAAFLVTQTEDIRTMRLFAHTLVAISRAEMEQAIGGGVEQPALKDYLKHIRGKTAALFAAASEGGAILAGASEMVITDLRNYGFNLGIAFQIVDDILDFIGDEAELGKPQGSDLRQGTVTLPTIYFMEEHPDYELLRRVTQRWAPPEQVRLVVEQIHHSPAIERAYTTAADFATRAKASLHNLPESPYRQALADLAEYVTERRR